MIEATSVALKAGDKVKCVNSGGYKFLLEDADRVFDVKRVYKNEDEDFVEVFYLGHTEKGYYLSRFEKVVPAIKLKVGEYVKVLKARGTCFDDGDILVVSNVDHSDNTIGCRNSEGMHQWFMEENLQLMVGYTPVRKSAVVKAAPFKAGDTVKVVNNSSCGYEEGTIAVVENMSSNGNYVYIIKCGGTIDYSHPLSDVVLYDGPVVINDSEWSFEVTYGSQIDIGEASKELTRKNPVILIDDPESDEMIALVSTYFQGKLAALDIPFFEPCDIRHYDGYSCFWVARDKFEEFMDMIKSVAKESYPKEARRKVKVTLPRMK